MPNSISSSTEPLLPAQSVLITGGARSGKSGFAEELASSSTSVIYLATAQGLDAEMEERIRRHQAERAAGWETIEEPLDIAEVIERKQRDVDLILVDCLTLWISNLIGSDHSDADVDRKVSELTKTLERLACKVLLVTNEVGQGIVPANPLARRFRDLAGRSNQAVARTASRVYWVVSGIPVRLK